MTKSKSGMVTKNTPLSGITDILRGGSENKISKGKW